MIQLIGWTILHSLWQITLITALYWITKLSFRKTSANTQYFSGIGALIASFLAPVLTFYYLWSIQAPTLTATTLTPIATDKIHPTVPFNMEEVGAMTPASFLDYLPIMLPYLVVFWGVGVLYFTFRFLQNLNGVNQLKNAENEWIGREWLTRIETFKAQLGIQKQVQVYLSSYVKEPLTFGHFKPVILLPISLITGFDTKAIETIILHELAHIKRHDYLVNLGQSIIEIILFYHPLVWWLSNEIRTVREHCCDDLVLKIGDNRTTYVETLTALQWRKAGVRSNQLSLTAIGVDGDFSKRIKRMFGVEEERKFSTKRLFTFLGLFFLLSTVSTWVNQQIATNEIESIEAPITFIINDKTTQTELENWAEEAQKRNIQIDFSPCVFDENNQLIEVRGTYNFKGNSGDFFAADLPCIHIKFVLEENHLPQPTFLYPCREAAEEIGNIFHINGNTERKDLLIWTKKLANNKIAFNCDNSVFDSEGKLINFNVSYQDEHSRGSFSATDMTCSRFYFELVGNVLVGPTFLKEGETPTSIEDKNAKPIDLLYEEATGKLGFTIYKGMPGEEFFKQIANFQDLTGAEIIFDDITLYQDNMVVGSIKGKIQPNQDGELIHYFDIHDLEKYSLQITGTTNQIFPPAYIDNATSQAIKSKEIGSGEKSTFIANRQTTKEELANWAKSILKHGVVFNYEKSVFDEKDQLIGLNGKFMGKCCYDDEFYINVEETQVQLEIEDDYIYQPTIIKDGLSSAFDLEKEFEEAFTPLTISNKEATKEVKAKFAIIREQIDNSSKLGENKTKGDDLHWIQWGDKKIPFSPLYDISGAVKLELPKLQFTKKEWDYLRKQPLTFYLAEEWVKIKGMYMVVLVPQKGDPISANLHKNYYQIIKDENETFTRLMARADVGDILYFEKIDVGADFTFGMVIEIIADPNDKSTGYHPNKDQNLNENIEIDFKEAESDFSKGRIPAYQGKVASGAFTPSLLNEVKVPSFQKGFIFPRGGEINNKPTFVNGVKYDESWMSDILPENIESINVVRGVKAKTLYGVEEAILITTKKGASNFLSKPVIKKEELLNMN